MDLDKMKELSAEVDKEMPWFKGLIDLMWPVFSSYEEKLE